jgi:hypothetical protein
MKIPIVLLCATFMLQSARSENLSDADREALLDNLEKLRETVDSRQNGKYRMALSTFRNAMSSDDQAMELYLNCIEKVNYEDEQKKTQEFREWKRKEAEKLSDPGLRRALRFQLSWLVLTLQAAAENPDMTRLSRDAESIVDSIFSDAESLASQEQILSQAVTSSVFARAYEVNNVKVEKWPLAPAQLEDVYSQLIFPPLRKPSQVSALRSAWIKRIQQERAKHKNWGDTGRGDDRRGNNQAAQAIKDERFASDTLPKMQWSMELELYRYGDESGAAVRMLAHLEKYLTHPSAREWGEQFKALLSPKPAAPTVPAAPVGTETSAADSPEAP